MSSKAARRPAAGWRSRRVAVGFAVALAVRCAAPLAAPAAPAADPASCTIAQVGLAFSGSGDSRGIKADIASRIERNGGQAAAKTSLLEYVRACYGDRGLFYLSAAYAIPGTRWIDAPTSRELLSEAAHSYPPAQTLLGLNQLVGNNGFPRNEGAALSLLSKAARAGEAAAMVWVGLAYESGQIPGKGTEDAGGLYRRAAEQGYAPGATAAARLILAGRLEGERGEARRRLEWSAKEGDGEGQFLLARLLLAEGDGARRSEAIGLVREAADGCYEPAKDALAQLELSNLPVAGREPGACRSLFWEWILK